MSTIGRFPPLCPSGKRCYLTAEDAEAVIAEQASVPAAYHRKGRGPMSKYRHDCGFFHLSSMDQRVFGERVLRDQAAA